MSQSIDFSAVTDATFNGSTVDEIKLNGTSIWTGAAPSWEWTMPTPADNAWQAYDYIHQYLDQSAPGYINVFTNVADLNAGRTSIAGLNISWLTDSGLLLMYNADNSVTVVRRDINEGSMHTYSTSGLPIVGYGQMGTTTNYGYSGYEGDVTNSITPCSTGSISIGGPPGAYGGQYQLHRVAEISNTGQVTQVYSGTSNGTTYWQYEPHADSRTITTTKTSATSFTVHTGMGSIGYQVQLADIEVKIGDFGLGYNIWDRPVTKPEFLTVNRAMQYASNYPGVNTAMIWYPQCRNISSINERMISGGTYAG